MTDSVRFAGLMIIRLFVFAQDVEVLDEGTHGREGLLITIVRTELDIGIEEVLPLAPGNRERLDTGEVHVIERQDREDVRQGSRLVGQSETDGRLVNLILRHFQGIVEDQEAGEILLIGFNAGPEDLQAEQFGGQFRGHGADAPELLLRHVGRTFRRILRLHQMDPGTLPLEERAGLVDGHVMRPHLPDIPERLAGKGHQVLTDPEIHLSLDLPVILAEQFEIMDQSA